MRAGHTCRVSPCPPADLDAFPWALRRYRGDELAPLVEAVSRSLDHLRPWMPWASAEPLAPSLAAFVGRSVVQFDQAENFSYAIWDDAAHKLVGSVGLHPRLGPDAIEIGYWVRVGWLRRGVATAAAAALTSAAFAMDGMTAVHIRCDEANLASAAVPRRLGFELRGVFEDEIAAPAEVGRSMDWIMRRERWAKTVRDGSGRYDSLEDNERAWPDAANQGAPKA